MNGKPRQKVVAYLGRLDELQREGAIDSLVEGLARYARRTQVLDAAQDFFVHAAKEYGPVLVFKRLWEELGLGEFLAKYVAERGYEFDVVAAIFAMVLNRLLCPCSKLGVSRWIEEVEEPSFSGLSLHHFYRALDVLWEHKERLEEDLFRKRRDLFSREVAENLKAKEVRQGEKRYIVCLNEEEAERERRAREEMVGKLVEKLSRGGLRGLVGDRGYRRYLRIEGAKAEIDEGALKRKARYDGKYVLLTDCDLPAEEVALAYKGLWQVKAVHLEVKGKPNLARTELSGHAYQGFRAVGMAVPPRVVEL